MDAYRLKEERKLWHHLKEFGVLIGISTTVLLFIDRIVPRGILNIGWLEGVYPFLYAILWGMIMGYLLIYGDHRLGDPIHHILKQVLPSHVEPITAAISDTIIVSLSLILAHLFKDIFAKMSNTDVTPGLLEQLIGFIIGRVIIILLMFRTAEVPKHLYHRFKKFE